MKRRSVVLTLLAAGTVAAVLAWTLVNAPDAIAPHAEAESPTPSPSGTEQAMTTSSASPEPLRPSRTTLSADERERLAAAVTRAVNSAVPGTDLGFALYDRQLGETLVAVDADEQFYTASVVKLLIAIDLLHRGGWHAPNETTRKNLTEMLAGSNDGIADALWDSGGGTAIVKRAVSLIGLARTAPPRVSDQWEMTRTTANDLVAVYQFLENDVPSFAGAPILEALAGAPRKAADGFDQYFGIPGALPAGQWAIKQGWMPINRAIVLNSTGVVGTDARYVVVLFTEQPLSTSYERGRAAVTAGIAAVTPAMNEVFQR